MSLLRWVLLCLSEARLAARPANSRAAPCFGSCGGCESGARCHRTAVLLGVPSSVHSGPSLEAVGVCALDTVVGEVVVWFFFFYLQNFIEQSWTTFITSNHQERNKEINSSLNKDRK